MPRLLQVVHGFPPRENAGTEQYAARLAAGLTARGWTVHTVAPTLLPGGRAYARLESPGLTRFVQNAPWAALRTGPDDPAVDALVADVARRFRPDLVHRQHLHGPSTSLPLPAPAVWTLHDAWAWCPAGGLLLRDGRPCDGPGPGCVACAGGWVRDAPGVAAALRVAGALGRVVPPERLHAAWKRLPPSVRRQADRGRAAPVSPATLDRRAAAFRSLARRCAALVSPSRWLADAARAQGLPAPEVIPHGVDPLPRGVPAADAPFLFLGTLAPHKGPARVREAWMLAGRPAPLRMHGPPGPDAAYVATLDAGPPLPAEAVPAALASARALVMGSTWPENAPLVILEARAAGCPVIAPAVGGIPEIVAEGVDGWLYPPGDVAALADRLRLAMGPRPPVRPPPTFAAHLDALEALYRRVG